MRVKVLKSFIDGKKKCLYTVGQIIEVTKKRYDEMNSTSNGSLVEEITGEDLNEDSEEEDKEEE